MTAAVAGVRRFAEPGARWRSLLSGPALASVGFGWDRALGAGLHWVSWTLVALLISLVVLVQVKAGRQHASVELSGTTLRQGTETVELEEIAELFPAPDPDRAPGEVCAWESARALGELRGVPRRRTGVGLRLTNGGLVQAWAVNHAGLRKALEEALGQRG